MSDLAGPRLRSILVWWCSGACKSSAHCPARLQPPELLPILDLCTSMLSHPGRAVTSSTERSCTGPWDRKGISERTSRSSSPCDSGGVWPCVHSDMVECSRRSPPVLSQALPSLLRGYPSNIESVSRSEPMNCLMVLVVALLPMSGRLPSEVTRASLKSWM